MNAYSALVQSHADAILVVVTALTLLATVGWVYVLHHLHSRVQAWYLSLPECPDCGGTGHPKGRRASCSRCDGFGRLKRDSAARETETQA